MAGQRVASLTTLFARTLERARLAPSRVIAEAALWDVDA